MAVDVYGAKGAPEFLTGSRPDTAVDLTAVGAYAGDVGNRKVGSSARRLALSTAVGAPDQMWPGLEFYELDTGTMYLRLSSTWVVLWSNPIIFGSQSAGKPPAAYWIERGVVHIVGFQGKPTGYSTGLTLPTGMRPPVTLTFLDARFPERVIQIAANGVVTYSFEPQVEISYDLRFRVD